MKQDIAIAEIVTRWQVSPVYNKINFVLLFAQLAWKHTRWQERIGIISQITSPVLPGLLASMMILANWNNPIAVIASTAALVLCLSK